MSVQGMVQTVLGPVRPEDLGPTMMHEHLICDARQRRLPPPPHLGEAFAQAPVTPTLRAELVFNPFTNLDDMVLGGEETAIVELGYYRRSGGGAIVEATTNGLSRDSAALRRIAEATGVHLTMGTGYYAYMTHPADIDDRTEDSLFEEMVREIEVGVDGVKAGHIGELGCEGVTDNELKVLRAAARAQRRTGAMLLVHQIWRPGDRSRLRLIADTIETSGGDLRRTVVSHLDRTGSDTDLQEELLERGLTIQYDGFGYENCHSEWEREPPQDVRRIGDFKRLIDRGWLHQLVLAQDICLKTMLRAYGGHGYAHILDRVIPGFHAFGVTDEQLHVMLVETPARLLAFALPVLD